MPNKTKSGKNQEGYFICGTIGELTIEGCPHGRCTFELIPEEQMKTLRNDREGYLWLPSDVDARGAGHAITQYGKTVQIDFSQNYERFLNLLIAAKTNLLPVRVEAIGVADKNCEPKACAISLM